MFWLTPIVRGEIVDDDIEDNIDWVEEDVSWVVAGVALTTGILESVSETVGQDRTEVTAAALERSQ